MSEAPKSREAQLAEGHAVYNKIAQLDGWDQPLPSKTYPQILETAGVKIRRQEEPTVEGGKQVEVVSIVYKGNSELTLCADGRILVNGYDDVQSIDPEAYSEAVASIEGVLSAIAQEKSDRIDAKKADVRASLADFLG